MLTDMQLAAQIAGQLLPAIIAERGGMLSSPQSVLEADYDLALRHAWQLIKRAPTIGSSIVGQQRPR